MAKDYSKQRGAIRDSDERLRDGDFLEGLKKQFNNRQTNYKNLEALVSFRDSFFFFQ